MVQKSEKGLFSSLEEFAELYAEGWTKLVVENGFEATSTEKLVPNSPRFILEAMVVFSFITSDCSIVCKCASSPALLLVTF